MKTKEEIVQMVVEKYSDNSQRATTGNICFYVMGDGRKCAAGMFMENPQLHHYSTGIEDLIRIKGQAIFQKEYQGHSPKFWRAVQIFHDSPTNWTPGGLTEDGKKYKEKLLSTIYDDTNSIIEEIGE